MVAEVPTQEQIIPEQIPQEQLNNETLAQYNNEPTQVLNFKKHSAGCMPID